MLPCRKRCHTGTPDTILTSAELAVHDVKEGGKEVRTPLPIALAYECFARCLHMISLEGVCPLAGRPVELERNRLTVRGPPDFGVSTNATKWVISPEHGRCQAHSMCFMYVCQGKVLPGVTGCPFKAISSMLSRATNCCRTHLPITYTAVQAGYIYQRPIDWYLSPVSGQTEVLALTFQNPWHLHAQR